MNEFEENMNEYDESRRILELIRESKQSSKNNTLKGGRLLNEQKVSDQIELEQSDRKEQEKKFREIISPRVSFNKFMLYPKSGNAEWSGKFQDSRIEWFFSLDDTRGVYITTDLLRLDDSTLTTIKKMVGFYDNWANEWANKIADEYGNMLEKGEEETPETPETQTPESETPEQGKGL
jgi:hypothetical protein